MLSRKVYVCNYGFGDALFDAARGLLREGLVSLRNKAGPAASWCLRKRKRQQSIWTCGSFVHGISSAWTEYGLFTINNLLFWFCQNYISMGHGLFATHQIFHWTTFLQEAWNFYRIIMDLDSSGHLACMTLHICPAGVTSAFVPHLVGHRVTT